VNRVVRVAAAAAALVALAGCVRLDMDLSIGTDDTLDGAIVIAFDKKALGPFVDANDLLGQVEKRNPLGRRPARGSVAVEPYDADGLVGKRYRYTGVPLADLDPAGALHFRHSGRRYVLDGSLDLTAHGDARVNLGTLTNTASAIVRVTFPGRIFTANGDIAGRSVTWKPKFGATTPLAAEADDGRPVPVAHRPAGQTGPPVWLLVAAGAAAAIALLGLLWSARRFAARRRAASSGAPPDAPEPDQPRNPTLPLPVLEAPDSLLRDPRWSEQNPSDPWSTGQS
jgi:hypothetical protein